MSSDTEDHSHLPNLFEQMSISRESKARLLASIELPTDLKMQLRVIDVCIAHENHHDNLLGELELLEHRREMMREDPSCDDHELVANAVLITDVALKLEREQRARKAPPDETIAVLTEERPRFRGTRRGKSRGW